MMEAVNTSETSVKICETTLRNTQGDIHLHIRRRDNQVIPLLSWNIEDAFNRKEQWKEIKRSAS
jgi:hypothetical protein